MKHSPFDPLAPEGPLPQWEAPSGPEPQNLPTVRLGRDSVQPQFITDLIGAGATPVPYRVELDKRTRHVLLRNDGDAAAPPGSVLFFTWAQPLPLGNGGFLEVGDILALDDVYLVTPTLYLSVALPVAIATRFRLWYW